jgi:hypothetical protein
MRRQIRRLVVVAGLFAFLAPMQARAQGVPPETAAAAPPASPEKGPEAQQVPWYRQVKLSLNVVVVF